MRISKIFPLFIFILFFLLLFGCRTNNIEEPARIPEETREDLTFITESTTQQEDAKPKTEAEDPQETIKEEPETFKDYDGEKMAMEEGWLDFAGFVKGIRNAHWGLGEGLEVEYWYDGVDTVAGVQAEKASWKNNETNPECPRFGTFWVDDSGNILKAELNGQVMGEELYPMLKLYAVPPLAPFALGDYDPAFNVEFKKTLAGQNIDGWDLIKWESEKEQIGGRLIDVYSLELKHPGWGDLIASFSYGDFGPFKIILSHEAYTMIDTHFIAIR